MKRTFTAIACAFLPSVVQSVWPEPAGAGYTLSNTLTDGTPTTGELFGTSVVMVGGSVVVGIPVEGVVRMYDGATGNLQVEFQNPNPGSGNLFGIAVAGVFRHVLVGAPFADGTVVDEGAAYLFDADPASATFGDLMETLNNPTPDSGDQFGRSVAFFDHHVLIGAPGDDDASGSGVGAAHLMEDDGTLLRTLAKPSPTGPSAFGMSVSRLGAHILVGDPADNQLGQATGAAILFDGVPCLGFDQNLQCIPNPQYGQPVHTFLPPTVVPFGNFGTVVSEIGDNAVIGAPGIGSGVSGTVHIYEGDPLSAAFGDLIVTIASPAPTANDQFGWSVSVVGTNLLIGSPKDDSAGADAGAAYLFDGYPESAGFGNLLATFANPTPASNDLFGYSVAMACTIVVAAPQDGAGAPLAGAVHYYVPSAPTSQVGEWNAVKAWPTIATHAVMLPTGKLMFWRGAVNQTPTFLWDPANDLTQQVIPSAKGNFFCGAHASLHDGRTIAVGGTEGFLGYSKRNNIFDHTTLSWRCPTGSAPCSVAELSQTRWYATTTTLPNGDVLTTGGNTTDGNRALHEVYDVTKNKWTVLTNAPLDIEPTYPFMFVLSDGRVFQAGPTIETRILDVNAGVWSPMVYNSHFNGGSAVLYGRDKVMKAGANTQVFTDTSTARTDVIDFGGTATWREVLPMAFPRKDLNLVVLPDGNVLAVGGSVHDARKTTAVLETELWNSASESWSTTACITDPDMYHSTAVLLPDGRVVAAGGDHYPSYQVFKPPYLFAGPRPVISSAPSLVFYGQTFNVNATQSSSISKVSLVRPGAVTHSLDQNQRYLELTFAGGATSVSVTAPASPHDAPPGIYMLFLVNTSGVPSEARFVRLTNCGDGTVDIYEQCDDSNQKDGDCCSSNCRFEPDGAPCADITACSQGDSCDGAGHCEPGACLSGTSCAGECGAGSICQVHANGSCFCNPTP